MNSYWVMHRRSEVVGCHVSGPFQKLRVVGEPIFWKEKTKLRERVITQPYNDKSLSLSSSQAVSFVVFSFS